MHKDQVFGVEKHGGDDPDDADSHGHPGHHEHHDGQPKATTYLLKWFFAFAAVGLIVSTCLGLWMALVNSRDRAFSWLLLLVGAAVPILLVVL